MGLSIFVAQRIGFEMSGMRLSVFYLSPFLV